MSHVALYGKIKLIREYCDHCQVNTLVVDGHGQCKIFQSLDEVKDYVRARWEKKAQRTI
jgi:hypothetical protein